jgi:hypothetical protein
LVALDAPSFDVEETMPFDGNEFQRLDNNHAPRFGLRLVRAVLRWLSAEPDGTRSFDVSVPAPLHPFEPTGSPPFETLILLTVARALVADQKKWAQGKYETFVGGRRCAVGAICVAAGILKTRSVTVAIEDLTTVAQHRGFGCVEAMNDASSHTLMLEAFDEAIGRAASRLAATRRMESVERVG